MNTNLPEVPIEMFRTAAAKPGAEPGSCEFDITELACAGDAVRIEGFLKSMPGVLDAVVNPVTERVYVRFDPDLVSESQVRAELQGAGLRTGYGDCRTSATS